ncbi:hypothetical protein L2223_26440, partial [Xanthomonas perforans]
MLQLFDGRPQCLQVRTRLLQLIEEIVVGLTIGLLLLEHGHTISETGSLGVCRRGDHEGRRDEQGCHSKAHRFLLSRVHDFDAAVLRP